MSDRIRFMTHHGKEILVIDLSDCSAGGVEETLRAVPEYVATKPRGSVLLLADFTRASIDREVVRTAQQTAVFDKPYIKKSALIGAEDLPEGFRKNIQDFSRRDFSIFGSREGALAWLTND